jgi:hypothetical protein
VQRRAKSLPSDLLRHVDDSTEGEEAATIKELPIVLKADVAGSLDALITALTSVSASALRSCTYATAPATRNM